MKKRQHVDASTGHQVNFLKGSRKTRSFGPCLSWDSQKVPRMTHIAKFGHQSNLSSDMLEHWVKVIWAKDGGSGTPWGPTIIFSEKKSASLNSMTLERSYKFWPLDPKSPPNPRRMLLQWRWRATMTRCRFVRRCPARPRTREISRLARKDLSSRFLKWWRRWSGQVSADVSNNFVRYSHFYTHPNVIATQWISFWHQ